MPFALKFMLTILVFEIKEGKNAQKVKKNVNRNLSLIIGGGYQWPIATCVGA
jgi:hypothetical protein